MIKSNNIKETLYYSLNNGLVLLICIIKLQRQEIQFDNIPVIIFSPFSISTFATKDGNKLIKPKKKARKTINGIQQEQL